MNIEIREYTQDDVKDMIEIWNNTRWISYERRTL